MHYLQEALSDGGNLGRCHLASVTAPVWILAGMLAGLAFALNRALEKILIQDTGMRIAYSATSGCLLGLLLMKV